jgi:hypothetical protein
MSHGIKLTDEDFENKLNSTINLNLNLKKKLSEDPVPLVTDKEKSGFSRSFDLIPDFSKTKDVAIAVPTGARTILDVTSIGPIVRFK